MCVCVCARARVKRCICVLPSWSLNTGYTHTHTHTHIHTHAHTHAHAHAHARTHAYRKTLQAGRGSSIFLCNKGIIYLSLFRKLSFPSPYYGITSPLSLSSLRLPFPSLPLSRKADFLPSSPPWAHPILNRVQSVMPITKIEI